MRCILGCRKTRPSRCCAAVGAVPSPPPPLLEGSPDATSAPPPQDDSCSGVASAVSPRCLPLPCNSRLLVMCGDCSAESANGSDGAFPANSKRHWACASVSRHDERARACRPHLPGEQRLWDLGPVRREASHCLPLFAGLQPDGGLAQGSAPAGLRLCQHCAAPQLVSCSGGRQCLCHEQLQREMPSSSCSSPRATRQGG